MIRKSFANSFGGNINRGLSQRRPSNRTVALAAAQKPATAARKVRTKEIEIVTLLRTAPDIGNWRAALTMAESKLNPDRRLLYGVYKEIMLDAHLISVTQRILFKCTNHRIRFYKNGRADDETMNAVCKTPWFYDMVKYIIESRWYGHSLIQCNFLENGYRDMDGDGITLIPRPNVRPEFGDILPRPGATNKTIKYRKAPFYNFLFEVGKPTDLGLLNVVASNVLYKRYGVMDWSEFLEVYGMPIREIQYDPNVNKAREEALKSISEQGSNAGVATPIGSMFKLHDSAKAGNSQAFETNAKFHNKEISKAFLLQTMTTEDGSSLSQSEVHEKAEQEAIAAYRLFIELTLNYKLKPLLERHGYPVGDGEFMYDDRPRISKVAMADLLVKLQSIADIPMSWVYETFGIPAPKSGEDIKDNPAARSQMEGLPAAEKKKLSLPNYPGGQNIQLNLQEAALSNQDRQLLQKIYTDQQTTGTINRKYFQALASQLESAVAEGMGENNIDWDSPDHLYRTLLESNVQRFSAAKSLALTQQLNEFKNQAQTFTEFKKLAEPLLSNYNINWMRAEYNHARATAQNGANYIRHLEIAEEFPYWEYQTVGDSRVRASHAALDGQVFRIDDPEAGRIYPPNGFNCRCEGIPRRNAPNGTNTLEDAVAALGADWDRMVEKGFAVNFADLGQAFTRSQEYVSGFQSGKLSYRSYGLKAFEALRNLPVIKQVATTISEWMQARRKPEDNGRIRLGDYRKRPIILEDNVAEGLASQNMGYLLPLAEAALQAPDEVWLQEGSSLLQRQVLKFYQGTALLVTITFGTDTPEAITAITLMNRPNLVREGILAFTKK